MLHMTMSGCRSVGALSCRKVYCWPGRSAVIWNPAAILCCKKSKITWAHRHAWCSSGPRRGLSGRSCGRGPEIGFSHRDGTAVRTASSTWIGRHCGEVCSSPLWVQTWKPTQEGWRQLWTSSGLHCPHTPAQSSLVQEGCWCQTVWRLCPRPGSWPWHGTTPSSFFWSSGVLLHYPHHHLVRSEWGTLKFGLTESDLSSYGTNMESLESMWEPVLLVWSFYMVTRWGISRPPLDQGRKSWLWSADWARPLHIFRNLVAHTQTHTHTHNTPSSNPTQCCERVQHTLVDCGESSLQHQASLSAPVPPYTYIPSTVTVYPHKLLTFVISNVLCVQSVYQCCYPTQCWQSCTRRSWWLKMKWRGEGGYLSYRIIHVQYTKPAEVVTRTTDVLDKYGHNEEARQLRG